MLRRNPEKTLVKARKIRQAASAVAEPSSADRSVAASAAQMESAARREISEERMEEAEENIEESQESSVQIRELEPEESNAGGGATKVEALSTDIPIDDIEATEPVDLPEPEMPETPADEPVEGETSMGAV